MLQNVFWILVLIQELKLHVFLLWIEVTTHHFLSKAAKEEHKEAVDLWAQICLYGGGLFLLLLIWQACRYEGNRWEAYF